MVVYGSFANQIVAFASVLILEHCRIPLVLYSTKRKSEDFLLIQYVVMASDLPNLILRDFSLVWGLGEKRPSFPARPPPSLGKVPGNEFGDLLSHFSNAIPLEAFTLTVVKFL